MDIRQEDDLWALKQRSDIIQLITIFTQKFNHKQITEQEKQAQTEALHKEAHKQTSHFPEKKDNKQIPAEETKTNSKGRTWIRLY